MKNHSNRYGPYIICINVLLINGLGCLVDLYTSEKWDFLIWSVVIIIALVFSIIGIGKIRGLNDRIYNDCLTGLKNKGYFYLEITQSMEQIKKNKSTFSVLMVDIDNFKHVNDYYGHIIGDGVLKQLSNIFIQNVRANDTVIRWGGEEFAIILPNTDIDGAYKLAERIRSTVETHTFCCQTTSCKITISVGIASVQEEMDIDNIVKLADRALYKAKEKRNLVIKFEG